MTAKEELREIYYKDKEIIRLHEQIEETEARLQKCTSALSDMPQAKGGNNDKMTDGVAKLIELKQKLNEKVDKACRYRLDCMEKIDRIQDGRLRTILEALEAKEEGQARLLSSLKARIEEVRNG